MTYEEANERCDKQLRDSCVSCAVKLDRIANEEYYKCPECEGVYFEDDADEYQAEYDEDGDILTRKCKACDVELETYTMFDYLDDVLDVNYTVNRSGDVIGGKVWLALGGPNIWIDVDNSRVVGKWGSGKAEIYISQSTADEVLNVLESQYECL